MTTDLTTTIDLPEVPVDTLHEIIETLAPLDRTPCSPGEREAAAWLQQRWTGLGPAAPVLEDEPSWGPFPPTIVGLGALGLLGGALALAGRRVLGPLLSLASALGVIDEAQNGPRVLRRAVRKQRETVNVLAKVGDVGAERKLLLLAHHDAAQTGAIFDQTALKKAYEIAPGFVSARKQPPPQWWIGVGPPLLGLLGVLTRRRSLVALSTGIGVAGTALIADIHRHPTVPGANDNLSGVAVLTAVAEMLRERPVAGVEVWLASCGAEETLQDGIRAFIARHRDELDPATTVALNFDTVGSPHLCMLEGEGPVWMEDYCGPEFRDLVAGAATAAGVDMERGLRARSSTDSVTTHRAGLPTACIVSLTDWRGLANYHLPSDTPENVDYGTVEEATKLAYAVTARLAAGA